MLDLGVEIDPVIPPPNLGRQAEIRRLALQAGVEPGGGPELLGQPQPQLLRLGDDLVERILLLPERRFRQRILGRRRGFELTNEGHLAGDIGD